MLWTFEECREIRQRLAAEDFDLDAFEPEILARIERATGRAFRFSNTLDGIERSPPWRPYDPDPRQHPEPQPEGEDDE